jgi:hypothetical protein
MGGLLVKQLLRHATGFATEYERIARATKAVIFFSTPHAGSDAASLALYLRFVLRSTTAVADLEAHAPALRELNLWYRNASEKLGIASRVFWETQKTGGIAVVNATSADPGITGVTPIPIDADHINICKLRSRTDLQYQQCVRFINERLPRAVEPSPASVTLQHHIVQQHAPRFVGRTHVQEAFVAFMASHAKGYFIVEGPPGQGKTALASHLVARHSYPHHFATREAASEDGAVLASLLAQLGPAARGQSEPGESELRLARQFGRLVREHVASAKQSVVIVIDGLDELATSAETVPAFLLTDALPAGLFFFVTSRPGVSIDVLKSHLTVVPTRVYRLEGLDTAEVDAILRSSKVELSTDDIERLTLTSEGNPLYVTAAAMALADGEHVSEFPSGIEGYFRRATRNLPNSVVLRDTLGFLAVARIPLSVRQLAQLVKCRERQIVEEALRPVQHFLKEERGHFAFYHQSFHDFVTRELLYQDELRSYHARFAGQLTNPSRDFNEYRYAALAHHLFAAEEGDALTCYVDHAYLADKSRRMGYSVLEDVELIARSLLANQDPGAIRKCVALVEALSSVVGPDVLEQVARNARLNRSLRTLSQENRADVTTRVEGIDAHAVLIAKKAVSADFVELVPSGDRLWACIGDAPGYGLKSAFVARFVAAMFRSTVENGGGDDPARLLQQIDQAMNSDDYFDRLSMQCVMLSPMDNIVAFGNAGHPHPVLYSAARGRADKLPIDGPLLCDPLREAGLSAGRVARHAEVAPGDVIVLVSDGLTEGGRLDSHAYDYRFMPIVERHATTSAHTLCERILADWQSHKRPDAWTDDVSVVVLAVRSRSTTTAPAKLVPYEDH